MDDIVARVQNATLLIAPDQPVDAGTDRWVFQPDRAVTS